MVACLLRNELPCISWLLLRLLHLGDLARRSTALPGEYAGHVRCPYDDGSRVASGTMQAGFTQQVQERRRVRRVGANGVRHCTIVVRWCL